jgi:hypothetical protein
MKAARIVLLILLGLTAMMQCLEGLASISNPAGMMAGLNLTMSPDVEVPLTFLGIAMIVRAAVTAIALFWIIQRKPEGLFLARFTALTILLSAPVVYLKLHRADFAGGDLIQSLLLVIPALLVKNQTQDSTIQRFEDSRR